MRIKLILLVFSSIFLFSCDEVEEQNFPVKSSFSGEFVKRKRGLKSLLSDQFVLTRLSDGKEIKRNVAFDLETKTNYLLDPSTGDTLDSFVVVRNKKLHYLIRGDYPDDYTIQAIRLNFDTLLGWDSEYGQMKMIDKMVDEKSHGLDTLDDHYNLVSDKRDIYGLYTNVLSETPIEYLIKRIGKEYVVDDTDQDKETDSEEEKESVLVVETIISALFPNPVDQELTIEFRESGVYIIEIMGIDGSLYYKNQLAGTKLSVPVQDIPNGSYLLLVKNTEEYLLANQKVLIEH